MLIPSETPSTQLHEFLGARLIAPGICRFCIWSPSQNVQVYLPRMGKSVAMKALPGGYQIAEVDSVVVGDRYFYQFDDGPRRPDPASRYQPEGVHGPSVVTSDTFEWTDQRWSSIRCDDMIIYEFHLGTFTTDGTFLAAIERLDELVELGINAIELMPVAESAGQWNWGYDGVGLFAPSHNYGVPDDLRKLVDTAHAKGLAVILDVVYNHLGPEGNYLAEAGPYLSDRHSTAWGAAPNFDDPQHAAELRRFFVANCIYWFDEFHLDGLRVDAIHCMRDDSDHHIVTQISESVGQWSRQSGRAAALIAESNVYDPELLQSTDIGGHGFDGQWCDDFLHSVFAVIRPGEQLSNRTYRSGDDLDQVLRCGYVYRGTLSEDRRRDPMGNRVETSALVYSIQNHDFIGNHPLGKRLHQLTCLDTQRAAAALLILAPSIPMLFMGEEFACENPFAFFVDFSDIALRNAVVEGRQREYPQHDWSSGCSPIDPAAFHQSKIGPAKAGNASMRQWYQDLIRLRIQWQAEGLLHGDNVSIESNIDQGLFVIRYKQGAETAGVAVRMVAQGEATQDTIVFPIGANVILDSRTNSIDPSSTKLLANQARVFRG